MEDYAHVSTPVIIGCKLRKDDESPKENQTLCKSIIGSPLFMTTSGSNIMHVVGLVVRFQSIPNDAYVWGLKRILRYLKGTLDFTLSYSRSEDFTLTTYIDVDWARSIDDKKSTSKGAFFLGNFLVSWLGKKQTLISLSTTEVEYITNNNMLHTSSLDEVDIKGYQGKIWSSNLGHLQKP